MINSFGSVSTEPNATGPARLEVGAHQFGLLAGTVASIEYLAALDESARGSRRERLSLSMQSADSYLNRIFDYLMASLRSLPLVMLIGRPEALGHLREAFSDAEDPVVRSRSGSCAWTTR